MSLNEIWCKWFLRMLLLAGCCAREDTARSCRLPSRQTNTLEISESLTDLTRLEIRHGLKGNVRIADTDGAFKVEITKHGASQTEISSISHRHKIFQGSDGDTLVLYVYNTELSTSFVTIIGGAVAMVVLLCIIIAAIWLYHKRGPQSNVSRHGSRSSVASSQGSRHYHRHPSGDRSTPSQFQSLTKQPLDDSTIRSHSAESCPSTPPPTPPLPPYPKTELSGKTKYGGVGSPRGLYRNTLVTFTLVAMVTVSYSLCEYSRKADINILLPSLPNLRYVDVFFKENLQNIVEATPWTRSQNITLKTIDLAAVEESSDKHPCDSRKICQEAHEQGLAACDSETGRCFCQRGYKLEQGRCVDINECTETKAPCPPEVRCENVEGHHRCHCPLGFFNKDRLCFECSKTCPEGQYEIRPCSSLADMVCSKCEPCPENMYEMRPCDGSGTSHCIHPAQPVLLSEGDTFPEFVEGLKVESSSNVFAENLHNTRELDTRCYITYDDQSHDFMWFRDETNERGVRLNLGLKAIKILPNYEDVNYSSDNDFVEQGDHYALKEKLARTRREQCRHPIPDSYLLTLETFRDRITPAHSVICNVTLYQQGLCPHGISVGDSFVNRSLNGDCPSQGSFPSVINQDANAVVCIDGHSPLLTDIFQVKPSPVKGINFPRQCPRNSDECGKCLRRASCDNSDRVCCIGELDCIVKPECISMYSEECTSTPIECAQGDAYRVTLTPTWNDNLKHTFTCHIRHRKPEVLYILWFYVAMLGTEFETDRVYRNVHLSEVDSFEHGIFKMDFITVEHDVGLRLEDEFILNGTEILPKLGTWNYTLNKMKTPDEYGVGEINVGYSTGARPIGTATVQFDEPFGYNTKSWSDGNNCDKNITKFKSFQPHFHEDSAQQAHVTITSSFSTGNPVPSATPFHYKVTKPGHRPNLRVTIPANVSVLSWWFKDKEPHLLTDDSLQISLNLSASKRTWEINVQGRLSGCPGYLCISINDYDEMAELFKYDVIIQCPADFNLTFIIPNWHVRKDKTFHVILDDAKTKFEVFLTNLKIQKSAASREEDVVVSPSEGDQLDANINDTQSGIIAVPVLLLFCSVLFCIFFLGLHLTAKPKCFNQQQDFTHRRGSASCCEISHGHLSPLKCFFVVLYVIFKIVYSFTFTFSMFFIIVPLCINRDLDIVSSLQNIERDNYERANSLFQKLGKHSNEEISRQILVTEHMQGACNYYGQEMMTSALAQIINATGSEAVENFMQQQYSVTSILKTEFNQSMQKYQVALDSFVSEFNKTIYQQIFPFLKFEKTQLRDVYRSGWLKLPQKIFNASSSHEHNSSYRYASFDGDVIEFAKFLGLNYVYKLQLWPANVWERFWSTLPLVGGIDVTMGGSVACPSQVDVFQDRLTNKTLSNLNASHFYTSTDLLDNSTLDNFLATGSLDDIGFDPVAIFSAVDWTILRLIFIVLDVLLLIYRLTHLSRSVEKLRFGFEESFEITSEHMKKEAARISEPTQLEPNVMQTGEYGDSHQFALDTSADTCQTLLKDTEVAYYGNNAVVTLPNTNVQKLNGDVRRDSGDDVIQQENTSSKHRQKLSQSCTLFAKLITSPVVPKAIIICAALVIANAMYQTFVEYMQLDTVLYVSGLSRLLINVNYFLEDSSRYLDLVASHISESFFSWYPGHAQHELKAFSSLILGFQKEQNAWLRTYKEEACQLLNHNSSSPCNITLRYSFNHSVPIVPCNFIPVQAAHYPDTDYVELEDSVIGELIPVCDAIQSACLTLLHIILGVTATIILLHLFGSLMIQVLKCRGFVPVRNVYILSSLAGVKIGPPMKTFGQEVPPGDNSLENEDVDSHVTMTTPFDCTPGASPSLRNMDNTPNLLYPRTLHMTPTHSYSTSSLGSRPKSTLVKNQSDESVEKSAHDMGFSETKV